MNSLRAVVAEWLNDSLRSRVGVGLPRGEKNTPVLFLGYMLSQNLGNIQRYTPITLYPTAPLRSLAVARRSRQSETEWIV